jgi:hypothetical protein
MDLSSEPATLLSIGCRQRAVNSREITSWRLQVLTAACPRRDRFPDRTLPTTKLGHPVTITARRFATPPPAMILRRVIEIEHAGRGVD